MPSGNNQNVPIGQQLADSASVLGNLFASNDLSAFFNAFFKTAIVAGAMLAVLRLGYAGFLYMTTDAFGEKGKAKSIIQDAVIGLLLLLSIWLILNQINPNLLNLNILQGVRQSPANSGQGTQAAPFGGAQNPPPGATRDVCGSPLIAGGDSCGFGSIAACQAAGLSNCRFSN